MSDENDNVPAVPDRREAVRAKARSVRQRQSLGRATRISLLVAGAIVAVGAVGVAVMWAVGSALDKRHLEPQGEAGDGFSVTSATGLSVVAPQEGISLSDPTVAPTETPAAETVAPTQDAVPDAKTVGAAEIRVYVDYLSPNAREWQLANAAQLSTWVTEGAADLTYYPVSLLSAKSNGTKYSLRAAGAAACVATYSSDTFFAFNNELFVRQPAVDADGFSDAELADIAQAVGVSNVGDVRDCITERAFDRWVASATERAVAGVPDSDDLSLTGTPLILVNDRVYLGALDDPNEFAQFVFATASESYYRNQESATPTPTPTPSETPAS